MNVFAQSKISKLTRITAGFVVTFSFCFLIIVVQMVFQHAYSIPVPTDPIFKIEKVIGASFKPSTMAFLGRDDFLILCCLT
jgi:hypothetical protein